tara:strand:- start:353 stop:730 length:378 start_codon:yes stop_codon:yes gene_type:complete
MGLKSKLRKLKRKLKKIKLSKIAKGIKKLATGGSVLLPPPFNAISGKIAKSIKGLEKTSKKVKQLKKAKSDYENSTKQKQLSTAYKNARGHYKKAMDFKRKGNKQQAYLSYQRALRWKQKGDSIK